MVPALALVTLTWRSIIGDFSRAVKRLIAYHQRT
jgi:hypothetical protein